MGRPVNGVLYFAHPDRPRTADLPGLVVSARSGVGPQADDVALPAGLHLTSRARGLAENALRSRARGGRPPRTLSERELGDWVDRLRRVDGQERLLEYRRRAEALAATVGVSPSQFVVGNRQIGAALGSQQVETGSAALAARQRSVPYGADRIVRFDMLVAARRRAAPQTRPIDPRNPRRYDYLPFFEAYFSGFVEGTEFDLDEAEAIVFGGHIPAGRPADAHDILGTYQIVSDDLETRRTAESGGEFIELLRRRHNAIMRGRPKGGPAGSAGGWWPRATSARLFAPGWRQRERRVRRCSQQA